MYTAAFAIYMGNACFEGVVIGGVAGGVLGGTIVGGMASERFTIPAFAEGVAIGAVVGGVDAGIRELLMDSSPSDTAKEEEL